MLRRLELILFPIFLTSIVLFAEDDTQQWKLRDSNSFFWDNKNKEIRNTIATKDKKIAELENILVSKNLALSVKEKENEQLKKLVNEMNKEKEILNRRVHIRDKEISNLRTSIKRLSHELNKKSSGNPLLANINVEEPKTKIAEEKNKTEEKIANYLISVEENMKLAPIAAEENKTENTLDNSPPVEEKVITKAKQNVQTTLDNSIPSSASQKEALLFHAVSSSDQNTLTKAYLSEFFLTKLPLQEILENANIEKISIGDTFNPFAMWAHSTSNRQKYPQKAAQIRSELLISSVARDRTNFEGQGKFDNLEPGEYYLIGLAQIGKIGTVWESKINYTSQPLSLKLTRDNAVWYE